MFLDHGRYIVMPEAMRQLYCQLWCSFIANDTHTAREVATGIAGEPPCTPAHGNTAGSDAGPPGVGHGMYGSSIIGCHVIPMRSATSCMQAVPCSRFDYTENFMLCVSAWNAATCCMHAGASQ